MKPGSGAALRFLVLRRLPKRCLRLCISPRWSCAISVVGALHAVAAGSMGVRPQCYQCSVVASCRISVPVLAHSGTGMQQ